MQKMQKKITLSTSKGRDGQHKGWIAGKWFFGTITGPKRDEGESGSMSVFGNHALFEDLEDKRPAKVRAASPVKVTGKDDSPKEGKIQECYFEGMFGFYSWCTRPIYPYKMIANGAQMSAIEAIRANYNSTFFDETKSYCVAMLYGGPGKGKSAIGVILANMLSTEGKKVNFLDCYDPLTPGEPFSKVYDRISPDENSPMIVMLEEFDTIIAKFRTGVPEHKNNARMIHDKATWNTFFDKFGKGVYKHVYFLMTTNKTPEWFDGEDPSYTRPGRVDLKIEF
jgi:hypothetical protein